MYVMRRSIYYGVFIIDGEITARDSFRVYLRTLISPVIRVRNNTPHLRNLTARTKPPLQSLSHLPSAVHFADRSQFGSALPMKIDRKAGHIWLRRLASR